MLIDPEAVPLCPWCGAETCDCIQLAPCACGGDCWGEEPVRPMETATASAEQIGGTS